MLLLLVRIDITMSHSSIDYSVRLLLNLNRKSATGYKFLIEFDDLSKETLKVANREKRC